MLTYYRSSDIMVTTDYFAALQPVRILFRIDEIDDAYIVRHAQRPAKRIATGLAALAPVVAVCAWPHLMTGYDELMAFVFALAPAAVTGACFRTGPQLEIRARCGRDDVQLFSTTDPTTFGQVRRALIRALEAQADVRAYASLG